uniref:Uncharacterized protein n=1 Tax=Rousettus aegyptiacus TaxID=9407 RepID=A0A7J8FIE6_ROUAE|nr:hypothetical protein HJG63_011907 [Rousettus aegyptiacus]
MPYPASFSTILPIDPARAPACSWSSKNGFHALFLTLLERGRDRVYKVPSSGQSCPKSSHSLVTHTLTPPEKLPVLPAPYMVSALYSCAIFFLSWILYFYCTFSMFRYTDTYHCVTIVCSIQYSNMLYRFVAWAIPYLSQQGEPLKYCAK